MKTIMIQRVPYGKKQTRLEEREYQMVSDFLGPVGTIAEWKERFPDCNIVIEEETE